jgi:tryptophan 2,3-dioxygenase
LCFVAGIGVTPLVAGCRALDRSRTTASIYVDYSGHAYDELAYVAELSGMDRVALSARETATAGRLTAADVRQLVSLQPGAKLYICGPPTYTADVVEWARAAGVPSARIHTEVFTPVGEPPHVDAPAATTAEESLSPYERVLRTPELLALQQDPDAWPHGDAMLFQIVHQTAELWLKEATLELSRCAASLRQKDAAHAIRLLRRVIDCVKVVTSGLDMLEHMSPWEYQDLRKALAGGSGFDSPGFRGLRSVAPAVGELFHDLHEDQGLALVDVYIRGREFEDLYQIAESLTELDERLTTWRMRHYKVAERVIGGTGVGTQGTPLEVLRDLMLTSLFPELWQVRNELTARS